MWHKARTVEFLVTIKIIAVAKIYETESVINNLTPLIFLKLIKFLSKGEGKGSHGEYQIDYELK